MVVYNNLFSSLAKWKKSVIIRFSIRFSIYMYIYIHIHIHYVHRIEDGRNQYQTVFFAGYCDPNTQDVARLEKRLKTRTISDCFLAF